MATKPAPVCPFCLKPAVRDHDHGAVKHSERGSWHPRCLDKAVKEGRAYQGTDVVA